MYLKWLIEPYFLQQKSYPTEKGTFGIRQPKILFRSSDIWITYMFMITYFGRFVKIFKLKIK